MSEEEFRGRFERRELRRFAFEAKDASYRPQWYGFYPGWEQIRKRHAAKAKRRAFRPLKEKKIITQADKKKQILEKLGLR